MQPKTDESAELIAHYAPRNGVRLNLAINAAHQVSGPSGSSNDVSNGLDRALLFALRKQADVIVTSGATARAENLRASKHAPIFVLTSNETVDGYARLLETADAQKVSLVTTDANANALKSALRVAGLTAEVLALPNLEPSTVLDKLNSLGLHRVLLEFGPTLAKKWSEAGCIDEVCLTITSISSEVAADLPNFIVAQSATLESDFYSAKTASRFQRFQLKQDQKLA